LGGIADLFGDLFDLGSRSRQARYGPRKGEDLHFEIKVPFDTAISGGKTIINLPIEEACPICSGSGAAPGSSTSVCPDCGGQGLISMVQGGFAINRPCPRCYGRGTLISQPCQNCGGVGQVKNSRKISVNVPKGIPNGGKIRLRGQGLPGTGDGPPGDVILTVQVGQHRFFRRKGSDIVCQVPINIVQAILGGQVRVKTIDGRVELKIPPGTQPGTTFRLRGKGISVNGKRGDQLITVNITVPEHLSEKQRKLIQEFARDGGLTT
jgi:molecular chaperone DnaJ